MLIKHALDDELTLVKGEIDSIKGEIEADGGYVHPSSHPASMIIQDVNHRFVTDSEKKINGMKYHLLKRDKC